MSEKLWLLLVLLRFLSPSTNSPSAAKTKSKVKVKREEDRDAKTAVKTRRVSQPVTASAAEFAFFSEALLLLQASGLFR